MVYMPEKDRLLMLVSCEYPHRAFVMTSDDHGDRWTEPRLGEFIELIAGIGINALDLHQPWIEEYFKANPLVSGILPEPVDD